MRIKQLVLENGEIVRIAAQRSAGLRANSERKNGANQEMQFTEQHEFHNNGSGQHPRVAADGNARRAPRIPEIQARLFPKPDRPSSAKVQSQHSGLQEGLPIPWRRQFERRVAGVRQRLLHLLATLGLRVHGLLETHGSTARFAHPHTDLHAETFGPLHRLLATHRLLLVSREVLVQKLVPRSVRRFDSPADQRLVSNHW